MLAAPRTQASARSLLTWIWSGSFIALLVIPLILLARGFVEGSSVPVRWIDQISSSYAANLGAILAFHFGSRSRARRGPVDRTSFSLALVASVVWNGVAIALAAPAIWGGANLPDAGDMIQSFGSRLVWFVAPSLGYFFGRSVS
jgi:hypothetical protein